MRKLAIICVMLVSRAAWGQFVPDEESFSVVKHVDDLVALNLLPCSIGENFDHHRYVDEFNPVRLYHCWNDVNDVPDLGIGWHEVLASGVMAGTPTDPDGVAVFNSSGELVTDPVFTFNLTTKALDVGGDFTTNHILLPAANTPTFPAVCFGSGPCDDGFYSPVNDVVNLALGGSRRWLYAANDIQSSSLNMIIDGGTGNIDMAGDLTIDGGAGTDGGLIVTPGVARTGLTAEFDTDALVITNDKKVGIGLPLPIDLLDVRTGDQIAFLRIQASGANSEAGIRLVSDSNFWGVRVRGVSGDAFQIFDQTNGRTPFSIEANAPDNQVYLDSSGSVGFGTFGPNAEHHVIGAVCIETSDTGCDPGPGNLQVNGEIIVDGSSGDGTLTLDGDTGGCLKIQDTDNGGFTYCTTFDGTLSCSTTPC